MLTQGTLKIEEATSKEILVIGEYSKITKVYHVQFTSNEMPK
jgi:hypothetical protein